MSTSPSTLYVGVDIAKESLMAAIYVAGVAPHPPVALPNTEAGHAQLRAQIQQWQAATATAAVQLTLEPTGGHEARLAYFAHAQGWRVSLANPAQVRDWVHGLAQRAKTDRLDALLLARFGAERQPPAWQPPAEEWVALQQLLARRADYQQMLQAERNRQQSLALQPRGSATVHDSLAATIQHLAEALAAIEAAITDLFEQHPPMQAHAERLDSIPGVGPKTVGPLLALCMHLHTQTQGTGTAKQLTALAGLDPQVYTSGTSIRRPGRISKKGDPQLRRQLFMASLGGTRGANALGAYYRHLLGRGKKKMVALIACARKLVVWAWAVFITEQPFDPAKAVSRT